MIMLRNLEEENNESIGMPSLNKGVMKKKFEHRPIFAGKRYLTLPVNDCNQHFVLILIK